MTEYRDFCVLFGGTLRSGPAGGLILLLPRSPQSSFPSGLRMSLISRDVLG